MGVGGGGGGGGWGDSLNLGGSIIPRLAATKMVKINEVF